VFVLAGFGIPNKRKRLFIVASMYGDARDVLLSQVGVLDAWWCQ
jgi:site-specific DNA-cytosine methylase